MVHDSDLATEGKFVEMQNMETILRDYQRDIRTCQRDIRRLDMVRTSEKDEVGNPVYILPNNTAGNEIDPDYRTSQKDGLIVNVDKLLDKLNGFLSK